MMNVGGGDVNISSTLSLCDEMVREILSRLPVKSLMRFKCVSLSWRSLIEEDKFFIDLHHTRSKTRPNLLMKALIKHEEYLLIGGMYEAGTKVAMHNRTKPWPYNIRMLKPVNGLVCFIHSEVSAVCIYNLSTKQVSPWIHTTIKMEEKKHGGIKVKVSPTYGFGFDPVAKEHKVICVWNIPEVQTLSGNRTQDTTVVVCEILTVGHNSWRRIETTPSDDLIIGFSFYANGTIYWRHLLHLPAFEDELEVIVAFDVGSEMFREILVPKFVHNLPEIGVGRGWPVDLLEVDGHVALLNRINGYTVKLWIFDDPKEQSSTTSTSYKWIEETITLPFCWDGKRHLSFRAVAGTDQIIIESCGLRNCLSLYSYSRKKKTFTEIDIREFSSILSFRSFLIATFVESLFPVHQLLPLDKHFNVPMMF